MEFPYKYFIICDKTKQVVRQTNIEPLTRDLETYEDTEVKGIKKLTKTRTAYVDTRYDAKVRLFKYLQSKQSLKVIA